MAPHPDDRRMVKILEAFQALSMMLYPFEGEGRDQDLIAALSLIGGQASRALARHRAKQDPGAAPPVAP